MFSGGSIPVCGDDCGFCDAREMRVASGAKHELHTGKHEGSCLLLVKLPAHGPRYRIVRQSQLKITSTRTASPCCVRDDKMRRHEHAKPEQCGVCRAHDRIPGHAAALPSRL